MTVSVQHVDIAKLNVDIIVNAANETLLGGGGVDGSIHRAAGSKLMYECWQLGGCKTGHVILTDAYDLPAQHIIHAVGPRYTDGTKNEASLLVNCYYESLLHAVAQHAKSIAFPAISCGAYRYPVDAAANIAMTVVFDFLKNNQTIEQIIFACSDDTYEIFSKTMIDVSKLSV